MLYYKSLGYDGIFITNHFLDGNIGGDRTASYEEQLRFYFADYHEAKALEEEIGIKVFLGVELSYKGTDFLVFGLSEDWYFAHPEIMSMKRSDELKFLVESGALVIQAHPFRSASYIDHIRLFPQCVHGIEVINANRRELENKMADIFCREYQLLPFAGSDNHSASAQQRLAGIELDSPVNSVEEFMARIFDQNYKIFTIN